MKVNVKGSGTFSFGERLFGVVYDSFGEVSL
jgi:hypothetical protein